MAEYRRGAHTVFEIHLLVQWLKGKTARQLMAEFSHVKKQFWGGTYGHVDTFAAALAM
jgi:REP element-mobilizing transposase RayT